jgi:predicted hydrocarbon binding protein
MDSSKQLPNSLFFFILSELELIIGTNGKNTVLKYSKLDRLIDNPPPNNYEPGEPVDTFSRLFTSLIDIYGEKGFISVIRGAGKKSFFQMMESFPGLFGIGSLNLKDKEPVDKFKLVYETYIKNVTAMFGTSTTIAVEEDRIVEDMPDCPWCVGVKSRGPICVIEGDFVTGMGLWAGIERVDVVETLCKGKGDDICRLVVTF